MGLSLNPDESRDPIFWNTMSAYVYIMTNKAFGTLYVGMTVDLWRRIWEHRNKMIEGFTKRYDLTRLVYYETLKNPEQAEIRESQIKEWKRKWKIEIITKMNPQWNDLYNDFVHQQEQGMDPDLRRD